MLNSYQMIYLSVLAADAAPTSVAGIVRAARTRNETKQIRSLLVFDGSYFCQYIEGGELEVTALRDRLCGDVRHVDFRVLYEAKLEGPSELSVRSLDYALSYEASLECFETAIGPEALRLLRTLAPTFDRVPEH